MGKIIAIVGMAGAGKSVVSEFLAKEGYPIVHFGDATQDYLKERGLAVNEKNERMARETLRKELGMDAFAKVNKPKIEKALAEHGTVVIDGLYSWEEFTFLKGHFKNDLVTIAIYVSPATRKARLKIRVERPLTHEEAESRDKAEIENLNKAGPIVVADYTVINEGSLDELREKILELVQSC